MYEIYILIFLWFVKVLYNFVYIMNCYIYFNFGVILFVNNNFILLWNVVCISLIIFFFNYVILVYWMFFDKMKFLMYVNFIE